MGGGCVWSDGSRADGSRGVRYDGGGGVRYDGGGGYSCHIEHLHCTSRLVMSLNFLLTVKLDLPLPHCIHRT
jgi:hypothetical protein